MTYLCKLGLEKYTKCQNISNTDIGTAEKVPKTNVIKVKKVNGYTDKISRRISFLVKNIFEQNKTRKDNNKCTYQEEHTYHLKTMQVYVVQHHYDTFQSR